MKTKKMGRSGGGDGGGGGSGRFQIFCANESRRGNGEGVTERHGIEMQLFKTAITEMKERIE